MSESMEFLNNSYLFGGNAPFIEELYESTSPIRSRSLRSGATTSTACRIFRAPRQGRGACAGRRSFVQRARQGEFAAARTLPSEPVTPERLQVAALLW